MRSKLIATAFQGVPAVLAILIVAHVASDTTWWDGGIINRALSVGGAAGVGTLVGLAAHRLIFGNWGV